MKTKIVMFFLVLGSFSLQAQIKYGLEPEFMRRSWQENPDPDFMPERLLKRLEEEYSSYCKGKTCTFNKDFNRVTYPNGWWFSFTTDLSVIELNMKPSTLDEYRDQQATIDRDIYDFMKVRRLFPMKWTYGANHIHIDIKSSGLYDRHFINFLVDFWNHNELAEGIFDYDPVNAPTVSKLARKRKELLRQRIISWRAEMLDKGHSLSFESFWKSFQGVLFNTDDERYYQPIKYTDLGTIEIRSMRAFRNASEMLKTLLLIDRRIAWVKSQSGHIALGDLEPVRSTEAKMSRFRTYVEEAGLNLRDYLYLVPKEYRQTRVVRAISAGLCDYQDMQVVAP